LKRSQFLRLFSLLPIVHNTMSLQALYNQAQKLKNTEKMPVLFVGHGSPMNAIEENEFVTGFRKMAESLPMPNAIICISAHWETPGTHITAMKNPRTIHDFVGFPRELYEIQYPASGSPNIAELTKETIRDFTIEFDHTWGLDHGCWSVIRHLYPKANVPVLQLSLDTLKKANQHYQLGKSLSSLREKGILIVGSGNMVHNLTKIAWDKLYANDYAYDWNQEASSKMKAWILDGEHAPLVDYQKQGIAFQLAIPTPEHYLPLLYTLGLQQNKDEIVVFNDKAVAGSLTMTSLKIG
jgi:4,5-DOPA dioxygenase extradiol